MKSKKTNKFKMSILALLICSSTVNSQSFESIKISVDKQIELDARYYSPQKEGPAILLLCQCDPTTDQNEYNNLASKLVSHGYHVMSFDYRGFGKSGGSKPNMTAMKTMDDVMSYWRENWVKDVEKAFSILSSKKGVLKSKMSIVGASCGNFLALEFALRHKNIHTLGLLGGPVDDEIIYKLEKRDKLSIMIVAGSEGPTFGWVDRIFDASNSLQSRIMKFKTVVHGTGIFHQARFTEDLFVDWFDLTLK